MKRFYFGQHCQVYGTNSVEVPDDFTLDQAKDHVKGHWSEVGLASEASYVHDSDEPDFDCYDFGEVEML